MNDTKTETFQIVVPELGESILEATVIKWIKHEGDPVNAGEAVLELETAKVNLEVSATQSGVLQKILVKENEDVRIGQVLGLMAARSPATLAGHSPKVTADNPAMNEPVTSTPPDGRPGDKKPNQNIASQPEGDTSPLLAESLAKSSHEESGTPVAKRIADEQGIDLSKLQGTGPGGRVAKNDVVRYLTNQSLTQAATVTGREEERIKMSRRRRTIAERLIQAQQNAAMLTTFNEVDMSGVIALRARNNEAFQARHKVKLGITSFFVKASIGALKSFPLLNAEIQGDEMVLKHYYDLGVAVAAPGGLVVPVLRDADRMTFAEIETKIKQYAEKSEHGTLTLEDLRGGTFTITNGGIFGSLMSTPILTYPQVAILGLHRIEKRPVVVDDIIVIRSMMYVAVTYDHRIVDGREAVQFLARIKELVENPENMLLEA